MNLGNEFIYEDFGMVFIYRLDHFYQLYDFNASVGDYWTLAGISFDGFYDSTGNVTMTGISDTLIGGEMYQQFATNQYDDTYWGFKDFPYMNKFGSLGYLFPVPENCLFDYDEEGVLRCYYDESVGIIHFGAMEECDFLPLDIETVDQMLFKIYPNPTSQFICISPNKITNIKIYDLSGNIVQETGGQELTIDIQKFPSGAYVIKVISEFSDWSKLIVKE